MTSRAGIQASNRFPGGAPRMFPGNGVYSRIKIGIQVSIPGTWDGYVPGGSPGILRFNSTSGDADNAEAVTDQKVN